MRAQLVAVKEAGLHYTNYAVGRCEEIAIKYFIEHVPDEFKDRKAIRTLNFIARTDPELSGWRERGMARMHDPRQQLED